MSGKFFAIARDSFIRACDLGMNPACALLVMASGTGRDNATTAWSADAISRHAHIRWGTAKTALRALIDASLVAPDATSSATRPRYALEMAGNLIWLPRAIVEGTAAGEIPPLVLLRQSQDVMTLRLFVELYGAHNLREDGGVGTNTIHAKYERVKLAERGQYVIWDFRQSGQLVTWDEITMPHRRETLSKKEMAAGINHGVDFFPRLTTIAELGLIRWIPTLFESKDGEPLHPMAVDGLDFEQRLFSAAEAAAYRLLPDHLTDQIEGIVVPVLRHIGSVQMIGVARLTYRPQTKWTAQWFAEHADACNREAQQYEAIANTSSQRAFG